MWNQLNFVGDESKLPPAARAAPPRTHIVRRKPGRADSVNGMTAERAAGAEKIEDVAQLLSHRLEASQSGAGIRWWTARSA